MSPEGDFGDSDAVFTGAIPAGAAVAVGFAGKSIRILGDLPVPRSGGTGEIIHVGGRCALVRRFWEVFGGRRNGTAAGNGRRVFAAALTRSEIPFKIVGISLSGKTGFHGGAFLCEPAALFLAFHLADTALVVAGGFLCLSDDLAFLASLFSRGSVGLIAAEQFPEVNVEASGNEKEQGRDQNDPGTGLAQKPDE